MTAPNTKTPLAAAAEIPLPTKPLGELADLCLADRENEAYPAWLRLFNARLREVILHMGLFAAQRDADRRGVAQGFKVITESLKTLSARTSAPGPAPAPPEEAPAAEEAQPAEDVPPAEVATPPAAAQVPPAPVATPIPDKEQRLAAAQQKAAARNAARAKTPPAGNGAAS